MYSHLDSPERIRGDIRKTFRLTHLFESQSFLMAPQVVVLDAGTAGGSGTAFIVITDDDIVTQVLSLVL
jgi:hypothetical protein